MPLLLPMVAMPVAPDVHVPPDVEVRVLEPPGHKLREPETGSGNGFTVTMRVVEQVIPDPKE